MFLRNMKYTMIEVIQLFFVPAPLPQCCNESTEF